MPLLDPAKRKTRAALRVRGVDSQAYNDCLKAQMRRAKEREPQKSTEEERNAEFWELNATLVAAWSVNGEPVKLQFERDGPALDCTPANVAKVLEAHSWVFEQVMRFATERANFLPGSASS